METTQVSSLERSAADEIYGWTRIHLRTTNAALRLLPMSLAYLLRIMAPNSVKNSHPNCLHSSVATLAFADFKDVHARYLALDGDGGLGENRDALLAATGGGEGTLNSARINKGKAKDVVQNGGDVKAEMDTGATSDAGTL
jgi:hypothetical protein